MKQYQSTKIVGGVELHSLYRRKVPGCGAETELVVSDVDGKEFVVTEDLVLERMPVLRIQLDSLGDLSKTVDIDGYLVKYEDGYQSWSPKEAFEKGNRLIKPYAGIGVESIVQNDYAKGIQDLTITLKDGQVLNQKRKWAVTNTGGVIEVYYRLREMGTNLDELLVIIAMGSDFVTGDDLFNVFNEHTAKEEKATTHHIVSINDTAVLDGSDGTLDAFKNKLVVRVPEEQIIHVPLSAVRFCLESEQDALIALGDLTESVRIDGYTSVLAGKYTIWH